MRANQTATLIAWFWTAGAIGCAATPPPVTGATPPTGAAPAASATASSGPSRDELTADVASLDALLLAEWKQAGITPAPVSDDGEFLRRVTLDLAGRVPTLSEVFEFLADRDPGKRAALVDRLLADPAFGNHLADVEGDLLFGSQRERRYTSGDPRAFLASAFNDNRPYDRLAHALLTATGSEAHDGAAAFLITRERGGGGAEAVTGAASRIFLGMQIQCAQCHDHPYDPRWKQKDFYGLVGYFARTRVRRVRGMESAEAAGTEASDAMADGPAMMSPDGMAPAPTPRKRPRVYEVIDLPRGEAKMHAPGATKEVSVPPRFLGRKLDANPGESRRQAFARAVVASDLFAKAFVGRLWRQLFGAAPLEPWDDLGGEGEDKHPRLLLALADGFRSSGHDVKRLVRRIVLSTAYARSAAPPATDDGGASLRAFARARMRPLTPEQLVASLMTATGADEMIRQGRRRPPPLTGFSRAAWRSDATTAHPTAPPGEPTMAEETAAPTRQAPAEPEADRAARLAERTLREYRFTFEDDEMADSDFDGTLPQALLLLNGEFLNNGVRARKGGVLASILAEESEIDARIDRMFLAATTRKPRPEERALFRAALDVPPREQARAYEDAFFALLVSTEATTNH
ncbi:MAG TPA: DUF1549 domain-containing protein [Polyangia bacterium]